MLLCPQRYFSKLFFALSICVFSFSASQAQSKKNAKGKQTASVTVSKTAKIAPKDSKSKQTDAKSKKKTADASRKDSKFSRETAKADDKTAKNSKNSKKAREEATRLAEIRRAEEARRRQEAEERRQAILAEQRRREQIARERRARAIAFERGLRTTTVENIARDNTEGEDLQIRGAAINALGNRAGMVVVMEAQTGKVLTVVNQDWAVRQAYRPCSTIKLVTGVAGLNENVIGSDGSIGNFRMHLDDALAFSNNVYFQKVGINIGNAGIINYARSLGLGEPTGINYDGEASGRLPYNNSNPRIYSHGDDFEVSPLQLAVLVSAISNGGRLVVPQVPRTRIEQANFRGYLRRQVNLPMAKVTGVIPGMIGAAQYGTAHRGVDASLGIAGKTGSCIGKGSWLGLFASVAPVQNPKYSVVVITRGQAERGKYAAAVAGKVYQALASRLYESGGKNLALIPVNLKPKSQVTAKTAAKIAGEEEEDESNVETAEGLTATADEELKNAPKSDRKTPPAAKTPGERPFSPVVIKVKKGDGEPTRPRIVSNK